MKKRINESAYYKIPLDVPSIRFVIMPRGYAKNRTLEDNNGKKDKK